MEKELKLRVPTKKEFEDWFEMSTWDFADDCAFANNTTVEEEYRKLKEKSNQMLPEGQDTSGTVFRVFDYGDISNGGFIWFGGLSDLKDNEIFLYQIILAEDQRGKGLGRKFLTLIHKELKKMGYKKIFLNVMKRNFAKDLYSSLGYQVVKEWEDNYIMAIEL